MAGFYRALDALVLPSVSRPNWVEQLVALIEAMACGVPVAGSNCGEIPHVIGDAGLVFPEGEAEALADASPLLAGDPATHLAERGRARAGTLHAGASRRGDRPRLQGDDADGSGRFSAPSVRR